MGGAYLESTTTGMKTAKLIFVLSFVLPYLVNWMNEEEFRQFVVYAPIWVFGIMNEIFYGGPTPMALFMIFYWIPYVFVGYQSYRFAQGKYSNIGRYVVVIALATLIGIIFTLSLAGVSTASSGGIAYYPTMVPLPLLSILAIVLIPLLRPVTLTSSWDDVKQDVFAHEETEEPAQDVEPQ